jgi:hypothetical protein
MKLFRAHHTRKTALALAGALLMLAPSAQANHATMSWTLNPLTTNSYGDIVSTTNYGGDEPATGETKVPTGWLVAHQVSSPATPITPVPSDEEQVGTGTATALWIHTFCDRNRDLSLTITWEATISSSAPANTVAQFTTTSTGIFNTDTFVVRTGTNDYKLVTPNYPTSAICSSTTDGLTTLSLDAELPSGNRVFQNPATAGTYTATMTYTDTNGGNHTGTNANVSVT